MFAIVGEKDLKKQGSKLAEFSSGRNDWPRASGAPRKGLKFLFLADETSKLHKKGCQFVPEHGLRILDRGLALIMTEFVVR